MSRSTTTDSPLARLRQEREKLIAERSRLDGEIAGIEKALQMFATAGSRPKRRTVGGSQGSVKETVFQILTGHPQGMTSSDLVSALDKIGKSQNPASVRSVLSAAHKAGILSYNDGVYRMSVKESDSNLNTDIQKNNPVSRETTTTDFDDDVSF